MKNTGDKNAWNRADAGEMQEYVHEICFMLLLKIFRREITENPSRTCSDLVFLTIEAMRELNINAIGHWLKGLPMVFCGIVNHQGRSLFERIFSMKKQKSMRNLHLDILSQIESFLSGKKVAPRFIC